MAMSSTLDVEIIEQAGAETARLYDRTDWTADGGFDYTKWTVFSISVDYDGDTYSKTYTIATDVAPDATFTNLFGTSPGSYFTINPEDLLDDTTPIDDTYFPDGYYDFTVSITYDTTDATDNLTRGFVAHAECKAQHLPLEFDFENYDYYERRLSFLIIALLNSARWAAEESLQTSFETIIDKINDMYDAEDISDCW